MLKLHNFEWKGKRFEQVETKPHHLQGLLDHIQDSLKDLKLDCERANIPSYYYCCKDDSTIAFYELKIIESGNPGICTYVVYECEEGSEDVLTNADIDILDPALRLQKMLRP